jgi:hypothetical protein
MIGIESKEAKSRYSTRYEKGELSADGSGSGLDSAHRFFMSGISCSKFKQADPLNRTLAREGHDTLHQGKSAILKRYPVREGNGGLPG